MAEDLLQNRLFRKITAVSSYCQKDFTMPRFLLVNLIIIKIVVVVVAMVLKIKK